MELEAEYLLVDDIVMLMKEDQLVQPPDAMMCTTLKASYSASSHMPRAAASIENAVILAMTRRRICEMMDVMEAR